MIVFVIAKILAVLLAWFIVRRIKRPHWHSPMFRFSLLAGVGFSVLAVAPWVLNVPRMLTYLSIDLAILCLAMAGILYYTERRQNSISGGP